MKRTPLVLSLFALALLAGCAMQPLGSGLIPYNQKMIVTAIVMADKKTSAHLS